MKTRDDFLRQHHLGVAWVTALGAFFTQLYDLVQRFERQELEVAPHQPVGDRHEFAEHFVRRLGYADGVVERLRHLVDTVEALEQRQRQDALRFLSVVPLQLAADQQVEFLVGAAKLDIGLQRDRIVALGQRVQELVNGDRLSALITLCEVVALEHAGDRIFGGEADHSIRAERGQPGGIECDLGLFPIEDEKYLVGVGLGVGIELIGRKRRPGYVTTGGIADHSGEVADQKNNVMPEVLKLVKLVELHSMSKVQIGPGRVEAFLDS